ncbi:hypothetical protein NLU14_03100 [Marinobacter sp. 71-i]|uniref:Uncharacterized protein n=1 Tax=Marinobacter iranensis TaxID=2962607 RepID=A0ABT5Y6M1_9GAMM|nr:hypothetical protein [Marinobacter iranensis]MDF0749209.1 hypothetical protein [Marinobacter iranensis]
MATRMRDFFPVVGDIPDKFRPGNGLRLDHYLVAGQTPLEAGTQDS